MHLPPKLYDVYQQLQAKLAMQEQFSPGDWLAAWYWSGQFWEAGYRLLVKEKQLLIRPLTPEEREAHEPDTKEDSHAASLP